MILSSIFNLLRAIVAETPLVSMMVIVMRMMMMMAVMILITLAILFSRFRGALGALFRKGNIADENAINVFRQFLCPVRCGNVNRSVVKSKYKTLVV